MNFKKYLIFSPKKFPSWDEAPEFPGGVETNDSKHNSWNDQYFIVWFFLYPLCLKTDGNKSLTQEEKGKFIKFLV